MHYLDPIDHDKQPSLACYAANYTQWHPLSFQDRTLLHVHFHISACKLPQLQASILYMIRHDLLYYYTILGALLILSLVKEVPDLNHKVPVLESQE